jgi:phosphate transport system substrate-binding protein
MKTVLVALAWLVLADARAATLKVAGFAALAELVNEAAADLETNGVLNVDVASAGGTAAGLQALTSGAADVAMSSRPLTADDRSAAVGLNLNEILVGAQAVVLAVSPDVWNAGVRAVSASQLQAIHERRTTNWKELGGPDLQIAYASWPDDSSTWEILMKWAYGDLRRVPAAKGALVTNDQAARQTLISSPGSIVPISPLSVDGRRAFALGIKDASGKITEPLLVHVRSGSYPLVRRMFLICNERPTGKVKVFIDHMLGARGQEILTERHFYTAAALASDAGGAKPSP